jgi:hypothetical protein
MTMMPPRTKIDGLNGGLAFRGTPQYVNPEAAGLVNPAQEQLKTAVVQTDQGVKANAAALAAQMAANAKLGALAALDKQHPLEALREIAAKPEITSNTGYVRG